MWRLRRDQERVSLKQRYSLSTVESIGVSAVQIFPVDATCAFTDEDGKHILKGRKIRRRPRVCSELAIHMITMGSFIGVLENLMRAMGNLSPAVVVRRSDGRGRVDEGSLRKVALKVVM